MASYGASKALAQTRLSAEDARRRIAEKAEKEAKEQSTWASIGSSLGGIILGIAASTVGAPLALGALATGAGSWLGGKAGQAYAGDTDVVGTSDLWHLKSQRDIEEGIDQAVEDQITAAAIKAAGYSAMFALPQYQAGELGLFSNPAAPATGAATTLATTSGVPSLFEGIGVPVGQQLPVGGAAIPGAVIPGPVAAAANVGRIGLRSASGNFLPQGQSLWQMSDLYKNINIGI